MPSKGPPTQQLPACTKRRGRHAGEGFVVKLMHRRDMWANVTRRATSEEVAIMLAGLLVNCGGHCNVQLSACAQHPQDAFDLKVHVSGSLK